MPHTAIRFFQFSFLIHRAWVVQGLVLSGKEGIGGHVDEMEKIVVI